MRIWSTPVYRAAKEGAERESEASKPMASKKGGTGRGTGKKGWNRWQKADNKKKNAPKPYKTKGKAESKTDEKKSDAAGPRSQ